MLTPAQIQEVKAIVREADRAFDRRNYEGLLAENVGRHGPGHPLHRQRTRLAPRNRPGNLRFRLSHCRGV